MTSPPRRLWSALMGPVTPAQGRVAVAAASTAALLVGARTRRQAGRGPASLVAVVAFDLVGGLVSFQLPPTRAAYRHHGLGKRLGFVVAHVQPFVLPAIGQGSWGRATARYGLALVATGVLEAHGADDPVRRREANVVAAALAAMDLVFPGSSRQRWLGPTYLLKVVGGHGGVPRA